MVSRRIITKKQATEIKGIVLQHAKEIDKYDALDMVYEKIYEILEEHNIKLDDLIH